MRYYLSDVKVDAFDSLPKSSAWEIRAFGRTRHVPTFGEHDTEVVFREYLLPGQHGIPRRLVARVPDSQLLLASINSIWHRGCRQPEIGKRQTYTIKIKRQLKEFYRLDEVISSQLLKERGISEEVVDILSQSRWAAYAVERNTQLGTSAVFFPCTEIVRRCACSESGFATAFMTSKLLYDSHLDSRITQANGQTTIKMPNYLRDEVAKYLVHYIRSPELRQLNTYVLQYLTLDAVRNPVSDGGGSPIAAYLPFTLPIEMTVTGNTVPTRKGGKLFLVDNIIAVDMPLIDEKLLRVDRDSPPPMVAPRKQDDPPPEPPAGEKGKGKAPNPDDTQDNQVDNPALDEDGRTDKPLPTVYLPAEAPLFKGTTAILQEKAYEHRQIKRAGTDEDESDESTKFGTGPTAGRHGHKHPASLVESLDDIARAPHDFPYLRGLVSALKIMNGVDSSYVAVADNFVIGRDGPVNFFPTHIHGKPWGWSRIHIEEDNFRARQCAIVKISKNGQTAYLYDIETKSDKNDSYQIRAYRTVDRSELSRDMLALLLQWLMLARGRLITEKTETGEQRFKAVDTETEPTIQRSPFDEVKKLILATVQQGGFVHEPQENRYQSVARKVAAFLTTPTTPPPDENAAVNQADAA